MLGGYSTLCVQDGVTLGHRLMLQRTSFHAVVKMGSFCGACKTSLRRRSKQSFLGWIRSTYMYKAVHEIFRNGRSFCLRSKIAVFSKLRTPEIFVESLQFLFLEHVFRLFNGILRHSVMLSASTKHLASNNRNWVFDRQSAVNFPSKNIDFDFYSAALQGESSSSQNLLKGVARLAFTIMS